MSEKLQDLRFQTLAVELCASFFGALVTVLFNNLFKNWFTVLFKKPDYHSCQPFVVT